MHTDYKLIINNQLVNAKPANPLFQPVRPPLNSGEPVALFKNQTIRLADLTLAVFKVVSTVAIAKTANKTTSSGESSYVFCLGPDRRTRR